MRSSAAAIVFSGVRATDEEIARELPGDDLLPEADVAIDRAFTLTGDPAQIWPWFLQLGNGRAGWYLPASVERLIWSHPTCSYIAPSAARRR